MDGEPVQDRIWAFGIVEIESTSTRFILTINDTVFGTALRFYSDSFTVKEFLVGDGKIPDWHDTAFAESPDAPGRIIRRGPWKLNYYHGYDRPQLFNLESDPGEWNDLGDDDSYAATRDELLTEVQAGWSGEQILQTLKVTREDSQILKEFHNNVRISTGDLPDRWTAPDGCNIFPEE